LDLFKVSANFLSMAESRAESPSATFSVRKTCCVSKTRNHLSLEERAVMRVMLASPLQLASNCPQAAP
jgi:hypothetical protein